MAFPSLAGRLPFVGAVVINNIGSGLFAPLSLLYFRAVAHLSIGSAGAILTVAGLVALPAALLSGSWVDRFGPSPILVASMALQAIAFAGYAFVSKIWALGLFAVFAAWGSGLFWPATGSLTSLAIDSSELARWFGFERAIRNGGISIGAALSGLLISLGIEGYRIIVLFNAGSFVVAGCLLALWSRNVSGSYKASAISVEKGAVRTGYADIVRDSVFMRFLAGSAVLILCAASLVYIFPVYVVDFASGPRWIPGVVIAFNTVLVLLFQTWGGALVENRSALKVLRLSALLWGVGFMVAAAVYGPWYLCLLASAAFVIPFTVAEIIFSPSSPESVGRSMGAISFSYAVAYAVAPAVLAFVLSNLERISWVVIGAACFAAVFLFSDTSADASDRSLRLRN
jgi:Major Facilitator Superfamily